MYHADRFILAALVGFAFLLIWPGRKGRSFPLVISIAMALAAVLFQQSLTILMTIIGIIGVLVIRASDSLNEGLHCASILWVVGAIGLAFGYGRFSLGIMLTLASLATLSLEMRPR